MAPMARPSDQAPSRARDSRASVPCSNRDATALEDHGSLRVLHVRFGASVDVSLELGRSRTPPEPRNDQGWDLAMPGTDAPRCSCQAVAEWHCYRCKARLCDPCSRTGGGWCKDCNEATSSPRPSVPSQPLAVQASALSLTHKPAGSHPQADQGLETGVAG